jgi:hypothetical protein
LSRRGVAVAQGQKYHAGAFTFPTTSLRRFRRIRVSNGKTNRSRVALKRTLVAIITELLFLVSSEMILAVKRPTISDQSRRAGRWALDHYQHKRGNKMKHRCKEPGELFNKAQSFGCRVEDRGKDVVIFASDRTVQPYIAHKRDRAFDETVEPSRHVHERYNTDVTQMIF